MTSRPPQRVLAVDPISGGFGYAVLEGPDDLVDWGLCNSKRRSQAENIERVRRLLQLYSPDAVVVEDCSHSGSWRRASARAFIAQLESLGTSDIAVHRVAAASARKLFAHEGRATKNDIATAIAVQYAQLANRVPPRRRPWMPRDRRFAIFDAVALASAFYLSDHRAS